MQKIKAKSIEEFGKLAEEGDIILFDDDINEVSYKAIIVGFTDRDYVVRAFIFNSTFSDQIGILRDFRIEIGFGLKYYTLCKPRKNF